MSKMTQLKQLFVISVMLVAYCYSAPWSDDNDFKDLKWHCNQLCSSNKGEPNYDSEAMTCYCKLPSVKDSDTDWKCIKNNARLLGLTLKIVDINPKKQIKRDLGTSMKIEKPDNSIATTEHLASDNSTEIANDNDVNENNKSPLANTKIRSRIKLIKPRISIHDHKPFILGSTNSESQNTLTKENEVKNAKSENLKELRRRIHERLLKLKMMRMKSNTISSSEFPLTASTIKQTNLPVFVQPNVLEDQENN